MKKSELKSAIKPLVKECISEILLEGGMLSNIVSEVAKGMSSGNVMTEQALPASSPSRVSASEKISRMRRQVEADRGIQEGREKLMQSLGSDAYGGVNLFEGVQPAPEQRNPEYSAANPLGNVEPGDPGVDIAGIMALGGANWKALIK